MPAEPAQAFERRLERKIGELAGRETLDGALPIGLGQREAVHGPTRSIDLLLRNAAIALGDMAHDLERGLEKRAAQLGRAGSALAGGKPGPAALAGGVELVPQHEPDDGTQQPAADDVAQDRAEDLAVPTFEHVRGGVPLPGSRYNEWSARMLCPCGRRSRHINSTGGSTMSMPTPDSNPSAGSTASGSPPMHESNLRGLTRIHQGKVRDIYAIPGDDRHMLIVTTDRLSAFDVVLPDPIPGKGHVLTSISNFWFARTGHIVPNHPSPRLSTRTSRRWCRTQVIALASPIAQSSSANSRRCR